MERHWSWSTEDADWSVALDPSAGVLHWVGVDKPRPGVPAYAQGGGGIAQAVVELLTTGRPSYACPPEILVEVLVASCAALPSGGAATATLPPTTPHSLDVVVRSCQAVARKLTGASEPLAESRRLLLEEELPDDRPTQSSGSRFFTEVRLGGAWFLCKQEAGGWLRGDAEWFAADFLGHGQLRLSFGERSTEITGSPRLIEVFGNVLAMDVRPELDDAVVHERAERLVRSRFSHQPDFVWEVAAENCREGLLVRGRASRAALQLYYELVPDERHFILHLDDASAAQPS